MPLNLVEAVLRRCFSTVRLDGKEGRGEGVPLFNGYPRCARWQGAPKAGSSATVLPTTSEVPVPAENGRSPLAGFLLPLSQHPLS